MLVRLLASPSCPSGTSRPSTVEAVGIIKTIPTPIKIALTNEFAQYSCFAGAAAIKAELINIAIDELTMASWAVKSRFAKGQQAKPTTTPITSIGTRPALTQIPNAAEAAVTKPSVIPAVRWICLNGLRGIPSYDRYLVPANTEKNQRRYASYRPKDIEPSPKVAFEVMDQNSLGGDHKHTRYTKGRANCSQAVEGPWPGRVFGEKPCHDRANDEPTRGRGIEQAHGNHLTRPGRIGSQQ
ncbi:hypothetical protein HG531_006046 [Fusarium graminearum]|nr:hypothetical protein HG531_006046 [Fusarium graminearum]